MRRYLIAVFFCVLAWPAAAESVPQSREQITLSFSKLVKQTAPAVVNIYTSKIVSQRMLSPLFSDPIFQQFFGSALPPGLTRERMENSLGSGVLVSDSGIIVTSAHVIEGADEIRVVLSDRREFTATLMTTDKRTDLAVLKLDTKGAHLPYLALADSDAVEVGDLVIAIGNPFSVGQTVTSGIVSALARTGVGINDLNYFIQTDAAINPGNSGGALVGMDGRLVGINAAIFSPNGGNLGIGFAVPANMVRVVIDAVAHGDRRIVRPWLGLNGQDITPELAQSLGLDLPAGILVKQIHPASPALIAGLRIGDAIMTLNGRAMEDSEALRFRIATMSVGSTVTFGILRKGKTQEVIFKLIAAPESPPLQTTVISGPSPLSGAKVVNISPAVAEEMGIYDFDASGVVIMSVKPRSQAGNAGLRTGDIIAVVNGIKISSVDDVLAAVEEAQSAWRVQLMRDGQMFDVIFRR